MLYEFENLKDVSWLVTTALKRPLASPLASLRSMLFLFIGGKDSFNTGEDRNPVQMHRRGDEVDPEQFPAILVIG